jgi:excisionase family DNA binding protein
MRHLRAKFTQLQMITTDVRYNDISAPAREGPGFLAMGSGIMSEAEPLLTPAEVSKLFRVDPKTVTRWAKEGRLSSLRTPGGHRRYREREVRALLGDGEPDPLDATLLALWPGTAAGPDAVARKKLSLAGVDNLRKLTARSAADLAELGIKGPALDAVRLALAKRGLALHGEILGKVALR